jgi:predicted dehydrogenase
MSAGLRLGVVGCGRIVERGYIPAALELAEARIVAFADPDGGRARRCAELWRNGGGEAARVFADVEELLAAAAVDAIVVATPAETHAVVAATAAAAGIATLVEKPPAGDSGDAALLVALDPEPSIAFNRRFLQGAEIAPATLPSGWLELDLELRFRRSAWDPHQVRDDALLDAGVHLIDLAIFLAGAAPLCVRGAEVADERASFELELGRARARIACATDRRHLERVEVADRAGRTVARSRIGGVRGRFAALRGAPDPLVLSLGRQLQALARSLETKKAPVLARAGDGVLVLGVVEAARRSAELDGAEVTVGFAGSRR